MKDRGGRKREAGIGEKEKERDRCGRKRQREPQ